MAFAITSTDVGYTVYLAFLSEKYFFMKFSLDLLVGYDDLNGSLLPLGFKQAP